MEHWSTIDAFYFTGMTMTTIGYGDITPHTPFGKVVTVFFAMTSVGIAFYSLSILARMAFRQNLESVEWMRRLQRGMYAKKPLPPPPPDTSHKTK